MGSEVARIDKDLKREIKQLQEQVAQEKGVWIGEAKALNVIMGRDSI